MRILRWLWPLGVVGFPIPCGCQSKGDFTTGMALLHLFRFTEAEDVYNLLVARNPDCAIGYSGIAMSRLQNPLYAVPSTEDEYIARQALTSAAGARKAGSLERAYLAALDALFDARSEWHAFSR